MNPFKPNRHAKVLVIADSMLKHAYFGIHSTLSKNPGATLRKLINKIRRKEISISWNSLGLVIINCGTNEIGNVTPGLVLSDMKDLVALIRSKNPQICIVINSILPRPRDFEQTQSIVDNVNSDLEEYCRKERYLSFSPTYKNFMQSNPGGRPPFVIKTREKLFATKEEDHWELHPNYNGTKRLVRLAKQEINNFRAGRICK